MHHRFFIFNSIYTTPLNYLAHCYLSAMNEELLIGNFIADHIKGNMINDFSDDIKAGIYLHRAIDDFTDHHPIVEQSKARLRPVFRKYATVMIDVFYDHYLAKDWIKYHHLSLDEYSRSVYTLLNSKTAILPERTKYMLSYMESQNWLLNYAEIDGIHKALSGLARRTSFESGMENGAVYLEKYYSDFETEFDLFFADLRLFVSNY